MHLSRKRAKDKGRPPNQASLPPQAGLASPSFSPHEQLHRRHSSQNGQDAEQVLRGKLQGQPGKGTRGAQADHFQRIGRKRGERPEKTDRENHPSARAECPGERSEEHTSELQSLAYLVCRLLLEKKN